MLYLLNKQTNILMKLMNSDVPLERDVFMFDNCIKI